MGAVYSSKYIENILLKKGFTKISQKGSHAKFRLDNEARVTVIVPMNKKTIPYGTFMSILRQSTLSEKDFIKNRRK